MDIRSLRTSLSLRGKNEPWFPIYTYNFEPNKPETIARQKMDDVKRKWKRQK